MAKYYLKDLLIEVLGEGYQIIRRMHGGMMNMSYVVKDSNGKLFVVYVPNGKANKTVNREIEQENTKIMEDLDLTSKMIYFDTKRGIKIKEYIEGNSLNNIQDYDISKVADLLHRIHDSRKLSPTDYHPFDRLAIYENRALEYQQESNKYRKLKDLLSVNFRLLSLKEKVFSHNDFQKSNIIKGLDDSYYVIDFEFAANNDEIYDIAAFANDSLKDGEELLAAYFNGKLTKEIQQRFYLWRIFISLQWHNVAIAKHYQKEGEGHKINFLNVAKYFLDLAEESAQKFLEL